MILSQIFLVGAFSLSPGREGGWCEEGHSGTALGFVPVYTAVPPPRSPKPYFLRKAPVANLAVSSRFSLD